MADFLKDGYAAPSTEFVQWCAADDMLAMAELLHSDPEQYQLGDVIEMKAENVAEVRDEAHRLFAVAYAAWQVATGQAASDAPAYPAASEGLRMQKGWVWPFDLKPYWWRDEYEHRGE